MVEKREIISDEAKVANNIISLSCHEQVCLNKKYKQVCLFYYIMNTEQTSKNIFMYKVANSFINLFENAIRSLGIRANENPDEIAIRKFE